MALKDAALKHARSKERSLIHWSMSKLKWHAVSWNMPMSSSRRPEFKSDSFIIRFSSSQAFSPKHLIFYGLLPWSMQHCLICHSHWLVPRLPTFGCRFSEEVEWSQPSKLRKFYHSAFGSRRTEWLDGPAWEKQHDVVNTCHIILSSTNAKGLKICFKVWGDSWGRCEGTAQICSYSPSEKSCCTHLTLLCMTSPWLTHWKATHQMPGIRQ